MDSLLLLCARDIIAQHPLPTIPAHLYPVLFQAAFLDESPEVLRDLVATWPFPVLKFQQLVRHWEDLCEDPCCGCIKAVIQGVVLQLRQQLEEPGSDSSGCQLHVLDMTGIPEDIISGVRVWYSTKALSKACVEMSKHQQEFQRHGIRRHTGCFGVMTAKAAPQPLGMEVHADLVVNRSSYEILCNALYTGAAGPLRLKFHEFQPKKDISALEIVTLLECLDPSCLRRVDLQLKRLRLDDLLVILPYLLRFPNLRSLNLQDSNLDVQHPTPESEIRIRCMARQLGMLTSLREVNLRSTWLSGNLRQILCELQAPLESLNLGDCSLVPADLAFLSQSIHAPALKNLDLSGLNVSQGLLELLCLLLEKTSASLLQLDLSDCHIADSHLAALLPTLLRCSRLRFLGLYGNPLSTAAIKDLLQKILELPDLHLVLYPCPRDCYNPYCGWDKNLYAVAKAEFSQLLANSGRTNLVWTDNPNSLEALDYFSL